MAMLREKREIFVFLSGDKFIAISEGSEQEFQVPSAPKQAKEDEEAKSGIDDVTQSKNCILAAGFSLSGKYFAVGDDQKQLHVYRASPEWELVSSRCMARRCTALTFPHNEKEVVVADRTGDVYRYSLIDSDSDGELLLGHLSMILDLVITSKDKYIVTCDRDEKIRISHYPNAYNIHTYCLLHTEYVSQVLYMEEFDCIISGSGDGKLACWSLDGVNLSCTSLEGHGHDADDRVKGEGHVEVEQDPEAGEPPGVKRVIYDDMLKILAVIYHSSKQLTVFEVEPSDKGCNLKEVTNQTLQEEPWDICFDSQHRLWVLQPCENSPVVVFEYSKGSEGECQMCDMVSDPTVQETMDRLGTRWQFFQASLDCQKQFISLKKIRTHENIERYLEKKEERINAQKNKSQPPQKKLRTS